MSFLNCSASSNCDPNEWSHRTASAAEGRDPWGAERKREKPELRVLRYEITPTQRNTLSETLAALHCLLHALANKWLLNTKN